MKKNGHLVAIKNSLYLFGTEIQKLSTGPFGISFSDSIIRDGYVRNYMGLFTSQQKPHLLECSAIDPNDQSVFYTVPDTRSSWQAAIEHCGGHQLARVDSDKKHRKLIGILHPGTYWIGLRYENGKYFWASDEAHEYHGWIHQKTRSKKTLQCAFITVDDFSTQLNTKVIEGRWEWSDCNIHRYIICEIRHDLVDYSHQPCPDCFYPGKKYHGYIEETADGEQCELWSNVNHDSSEDTIGEHNRRCKYNFGKMPFCKKTSHVTEGNQVTDSAWIRKFTQKMIDKQLCNVDRCDNWNENEFFSKDGSNCLLDSIDSNFSTPAFRIRWNICRNDHPKPLPHLSIALD